MLVLRRAWPQLLGFSAWLAWENKQKRAANRPATRQPLYKPRAGPAPKRPLTASLLSTRALSGTGPRPMLHF